MKNRRSMEMFRRRENSRVLRAFGLTKKLDLAKLELPPARPVLTLIYGGGIKGGCDCLACLERRENEEA